jgi:hypothetical protein
MGAITGCRGGRQYIYTVIQIRNSRYDRGFDETDAVVETPHADQDFLLEI